MVMDIIHEAIPKLAPFCQWLEDKVVNPWLNYQIIPEDLGGKQPGTRTDLLDFMDTSNPRAASKSQKMAAESVSSLEEAKAHNKGGYDSVGNCHAAHFHPSLCLELSLLDLASSIL